MRSSGGEVEQSDVFEAPGCSEDDVQRALLTVAVLDYDDGDDEFTEGIQEQLDVVTTWWSTTGPLPAFRQYFPDEPLQTRNDVEDYLRKHNVREMSGHALVVFVTGHGVAGASRSHYLQLPGSAKNRNLATSVRTTDIVVTALDSHVDNVLVIVNTCYAGQINAELAALWADISPQRRESCQLDVLVTCGHDKPTQVRRFSGLLRDAFDRLRTNAGVTTPHLSVVEFMAEFERGLKTQQARKQHRLHRLIDGSGTLAPTPCIPNPGYRHVRESIVGSDGQAISAGDGYWFDRATGRIQDDDVGWYFQGRDRLNRKVTSFLDGSRSRGVLMVTGVAGSGKSAVLARAVVLSDPDFRQQPICKTVLEAVPPDSVPPVSSVTAAVLARHKSAAEVAADILTALGGTPEVPGSTRDPVIVWTRQITGILRTRIGQTSIIVDGLDETDERYRIVNDVLAPLSEFCAPVLPFVPDQHREHIAAPGGLCLLIGVRSSRPVTAEVTASFVMEERGLLEMLRELFPTAETERTDDKNSEGDIVRYLAALMADGKRPKAAQKAAVLVAPQVWPSFIDARIAGEQLKHDDDPVATAQRPEWKAMLSVGTTGLLQRDLQLVADDGLPSDVAHALLRAAAFAGGAGVPWAFIWPRMAETLLGRKLENWDEMIIKLLNGRLNGYLTHDHQDDRRVYRPAHEALNEALLAGTLWNNGVSA
ncbi:P-loop NTPase family protein [Streptomyces fagopyri]|uniref:ATP-binding protein n=1 Tax=Streptomyces fagopyri TaxID=2662397 RepID=UPI00382F1458